MQVPDPIVSAAPVLAGDHRLAVTRLFRRPWLSLAAGIVAALPWQARAQSASTSPQRPNILFAIADDWSWPHAGAYGDRTVATPTFDRIAREGARFTHAFTAAPSCTPLRAAIASATRTSEEET